MHNCQDKALVHRKTSKLHWVMIWPWLCSALPGNLSTNNDWTPQIDNCSPEQSAETPWCSWYFLMGRKLGGMAGYWYWEDNILTLLTRVGSCRFWPRLKMSYWVLASDSKYLSGKIGNKNKISLYNIIRGHSVPAEDWMEQRAETYVGQFL